MNLWNTIKTSLALLKAGNYYSFRRAVVWPEGEYKRGMLQRIQKLYQCKYFVETGTYMGETPLKLHAQFDRLWTIELDDNLFNRAVQTLSPYPNITCVHGDSKDRLAEIVAQIDSPCLFWLDGHYSGGITALGEIQAPLVQEIQIIGKSPIKNHVIAIDDISDFSAAEQNAPLSKVLETIEKINPQYKFYFDYDMLFALPHEKERREFWRKAAYPIVIR